MDNNKVNIFEFYNMDENLGSLMTYKDFKVKAWADVISPILINFINSKINSDETIKIIEIGVHGGASLLLTFDMIYNKNFKLYGIDCWEDITICGINGKSNNFWEENSLNKFLNLHKENRINLENIINKYDDKKQITLIKGLSTDINIINKFDDDSIDFIYIDGDHSFDGCYSDINNWYKKLKKGGILLGDDYPWPDVQKAANLFCYENQITLLTGEQGKYYFYKK